MIFIVLPFLCSSFSCAKPGDSCANYAVLRMLYFRGICRGLFDVKSVVPASMWIVNVATRSNVHGVKGYVSGKFPGRRSLDERRRRSSLRRAK